MNEHHHIEEVQVKGGVLYLTIDGHPHEYPLKDISSLLASANAEDLQDIQVSPAGYGIHWPLIDEDISIDGLLGIAHERSASRKSA